MKTFFLIMFFGKVILLTPAPVNVVGEMTIDRTKEPLEAIAPGAHMEIDVSDFIGHMKMEEVGILRIKQRLKEKIPDGSVKAILHGSKGEKVVLNQTGFAMGGNGQISLILRSDAGYSTNTRFNRVTITSRTELKGISAYWWNHGK
jgi:hypothetical protein